MSLYPSEEGGTNPAEKEDMEPTLGTCDTEFATNWGEKRKHFEGYAHQEIPGTCVNWKPVAPAAKTLVNLDRCPKCGSADIGKTIAVYTYFCNQCAYQFMSPDVIEPAAPEPTKETTTILPAEQLVIDLARELYDRFVMGGWEPQDAYPQIRAMLKAAIEEENELAGGVALGRDTTQQDVCPDCGSTAQRMRGCSHQDHGKKTHALIRYECIRCTNSWHTLSAAEFYKYYYDRFLVVGDPGTFESAHQRVFRFAEAYAARLGEK